MKMVQKLLLSSLCVLSFSSLIPVSARVSKTPKISNKAEINSCTNQKSENETFENWLEKIKQKYPDIVDWSKIKFVCSPIGGWCMWYDIDKDTYGQIFIGVPWAKYEGLSSFSDDDEFALLHEIGHVRNHKSFLGKCLWKRYTNIPRNFSAATVAATYFVLSNSYSMIGKIPKIEDNTAASIGLSVLAVCGLTFGMKKILKPIYARFDEVWADRFACQNASKSALIAGYDLFIKHGSMQNRWHENFLQRWKQGFAHPHSNDRALNVAQAFYQRFGQDISTMYPCNV